MRSLPAVRGVFEMTVKLWGGEECSTFFFICMTLVRRKRHRSVLLCTAHSVSSLLILFLFVYIISNRDPYYSNGLLVGWTEVILAKKKEMRGANIFYTVLWTMGVMCKDVYYHIPWSLKIKYPPVTIFSIYYGPILWNHIQLQYPLLFFVGFLFRSHYY